MKLKILFIIFFVQGIIFTSYTYLKHSSSVLAPLMHIVTLWVILTILTLVYDLLAKKIRHEFFLFATIFGTFNFLILIFYLLAIYGYLKWSAPFTFEIFISYFSQIPQLLKIVNFSISTAISLLLFCFIILLFCYYYLGKLIIKNKNYDKFELNFFKFHFSFKPVNFIYLLTLFFVAVYVGTYKAWLPREPFAIAITSNWTMSNLAPPELFLESSLQTEIEQYKGMVSANNSVASPRPLILITVDALRADQMGVYGGRLDNTPFLTSLLKKGQLQRFPVTYSTCTLSFCGLLGILRSNYWGALKRPSPSIADVLKAHHYENFFLLGGDHTNFSDLRKFYGDGIDYYMDGSLDSSGYINDDFQVLKWLRLINPKNINSTFIYIHLMSVHESGLRHEKYKRWAPSHISSTSNLLMGYETQKKYFSTYANHYNNGILQADAVIADIFQILKTKGILDEALIIISADHGEYLGEFNRLHHGHEPYEPVSRIPLLVYDQLNVSYPERVLSSQVDIAPTFLNAIGARIPDGWQGAPLQLKTFRSSVSIGSGDVSGGCRSN